jgi:hypothetical protein
LRQLVGKAVVHIAVAGLVGPYGDDDVLEARVGPELPVVDGDLWRSDILDPPALDLGQVLGIADDRLLLKIADRPMAVRDETR